MELRFLAVHEEGASLMVPPRDKAIRVVLILQNPRALSGRRSWPKDQFEREIAPPMRIRSSRLAVVTTLPDSVIERTTFLAACRGPWKATSRW